MALDAETAAGADGFGVVVRELGLAADALDAAAAKVTAGESRRAGVLEDPGLEVPSWLDRAEAEWAGQLTRLVAGTGWGARELRATARSYRRADRAVAARLRGITESLDTENPGLRSADDREGLQPAVPGSPAVDVADAAPAAAYPTSGLPASGIGGLRRAATAQDGAQDLLEVWRERTALTVSIIAEIGDTVVVLPGWSGPAADGYRDWLTGHRAAWGRLCDDADRIYRALAGQAPYVDTRAGAEGKALVPSTGVLVTGVTGVTGVSVIQPERGASGTAADGDTLVGVAVDLDGDHDADLAVTVDTVDHADAANDSPDNSTDNGADNAVDNEAAADRGGEAGPDAAAGGVLGAAGDEVASRVDVGREAPSEREPSRPPDEELPGTRPEQSPPEQARPEQAPAEQAPPEQPPDQDPSGRDAKEEPRHGADHPAPPEMPGPIGTPGPGAGVPAGASAGEAEGQGSAGAEEVPEAAIWLGVGATAAAAGVAAMFLARRDRAIHSEYTPISEPASAATVPVLHSRGAGWSELAATGGAPPRGSWGAPGGWPGAADAADGSTTGSSGTPARAGRGPSAWPGPQPLAAPLSGVQPPAPPPVSASVMPPGSGWESVQWGLPVQIGTHAGRPLVIDLTNPGRQAPGGLGPGGLGIDGPGGVDVLRGLIRATLTQEPATLVVMPAGIARLLADEPPEAATAALLDRLAALPRVRVVPDPHAAVGVVETELAARRRDTGLPARADGRAGEQAAGPWLVIVPVPTTLATRHRLRALITAAAGHRIAVLVHGAWLDGWTCEVDGNHRVHNVPAGALPLGPELVAATADQLARHLDQSLGDAAPAAAPVDSRAAHVDAQAGSQFAPSAAPSAGAPDSPAGAISAALAPAPGATPGAETSAEATAPEPGHGEIAPREAQALAASAPAVAGSTIGPEHAARGFGSLEHRGRAEPPTDTDTDGRRATGRASAPRLALSILGPTLLRCLDPQHCELPAQVGPGRGVGHPTGGVINGLGPRALELFVFMAVHPHGVGRESVVAALWPEADRRRPTHALNATLARLRAALRRVDPGAAGLISNTDGRYQLDPDLVAVDYWDLLVAATRLSDPDPGVRAHACEVVIDAYQGPLAVDLTGEWLITVREATRRRYLDALTTLARVLVDDNPERTLGLLEAARNLEPFTEALYRDIMRIQHRLGRPEAAAGTLALLQAQLADIDATPEQTTLDLAAAIAATGTSADIATNIATADVNTGAADVTAAPGSAASPARPEAAAPPSLRPTQRPHRAPLSAPPSARLNIPPGRPETAAPSPPAPSRAKRDSHIAAIESVDTP